LNIVFYWFLGKVDHIDFLAIIRRNGAIIEMKIKRERKEE